MNKLLITAGKVSLSTVYVLLATLATILSGCQWATPTTLPPLSEKLGYKIPNFKGVTTVGLIEGKYAIELEKLKVLRTMSDVVIEPALEAREMAVDWINVGLSAGMFGGLPLALRKLPKGAVRKEEHEEVVRRAREET